MTPTCSIDRIRSAYPHLGIALYGYEPRGPVTLELLAPDGQSFTFAAATAEEAAALACPELFTLDVPVEREPPPSPDTLFD